jgi:peptidoglycan hydrolase FlgJ
MLNVPNADVYTDFNGLANLKTQARNNAPEAVKEVAKQFESLFLNMVLKSMREAKLADSILDSSQSEFYQDMYDQQLAVHLSGEPGIGLAELIARQLSPKEQETGEKLDAADYLNRSVAVTGRIGHKKSAPVHVEPAKASGNVAEKGQQIITSKEQFVQQLRPFAERAAAELGVDANVLLAQAALETGWGKSVIKHGDEGSSFNLFNIKADKSWQGNKASQKTLEFEAGIGRQETAAFRAYGSYRDSFNDYVQFIKTNPRYSNAIKMAADAERYMHELQQAGYATDPNYASKVMRIYQDEAIQQPAVLAMK